MTGGILEVVDLRVALERGTRLGYNEVFYNRVTEFLDDDIAAKLVGAVVIVGNVT